MNRFVAGKNDIFWGVESTFGTAPAVASFQQLATAMTDSVEHSGEVSLIDPMYSRGDFFHDQMDVGRDTCSVALSLPLRPNPALPDATESSQLYTDLNILKSCVGIDASQVAYAITGGNVGKTSFEYTGADPDVGSAYAILPISSSTVPEYRMLTAVDTGGDEATYHKATTAQCVDGKAIAGVTIYPTPDADSISVQFSSMASNGDIDTSLYGGLMGNVVFEGAVGDDSGSYLAAMLSLNGTSFVKAASPTVTVAGGATGIVDPLSPPIQVRCASFKVDGEEIPYASVSFDPGLEWSEDTNALECDGRNKWVLTSRNPVLSVTIPRDTSTTLDQHDYTTDHDIIASWGTWPETVCMIIPRCRLMASPSEGETNGIRNMEMQFRPLRPTAAIYEWVIGIFGRES